MMTKDERNMEGTIEKLFLDSISQEEILGEVASRFYETIEDLAISHRVFRQMLWEYESFAAYFAAESEELTPEEDDILLDMRDTLRMALEDYFEAVEDRVVQRIQQECTQPILEDLRQRGIVLTQPYLHEEQIEEFYPEAFEAYDRLKQRFIEKVFTLSPQKAYKQGEAALARYRDDKGILFDERDFILAYQKDFSKEQLWDALAVAFYQAIHYGRRYRLEQPDEFEMLEDGEETPLAEQDDGVLIPEGDFAIDQFEYVCDLCTEYTGRRVLAAENELGDEAYWTTYQEDFQELMGLYLMNHLNQVIQELERERAEEYASFGKIFGMRAEQRRDPEEILQRCDKINYYLLELNENLWTEFTESRAMQFYQRGESLAQQTKS